MTPPSTRKTSRRLLLSVILGGLFIFGAACMEGAKAPVRSANGALAPGASGASAKGDAADQAVLKSLALAQVPTIPLVVLDRMQHAAGARR